MKALDPEAGLSLRDIDYYDLENFYEALQKDEPALRELAVLLKEPIEAQRWDSVIGEEISGRYPAIFVHHLMKRRAKDLGTRSPARLFVAPNRDLSFEEMDEHATMLKSFLKTRKKRIGKRTLIVTEFIFTGQSISQIISALPRGVRIEIATVGMLRDIYEYDFAKKLSGKEPALYSAVDHTPKIYGKNELTGREKDSSRPTSYRSDYYEPELSNAALKIVTGLADEIYDDLFLNDTLDGIEELVVVPNT